MQAEIRGLVARAAGQVAVTATSLRRWTQQRAAALVTVLALPLLVLAVLLAQAARHPRQV